MQIKKYAVCVAFGAFSIFTAAAQDVMPEKMPTRLTSERLVKEVAPVANPAEVAAAAQTQAKKASSNAFGESVVKTALQYLGARYSLGSTGPRVFDCSGFTSFVYRKENVRITRTSRSQFTEGTPIARIADLKKGDLVFFGGRGGGRRVGHVGIVSDVSPDGNKFSFVHASSSRGVTVSSSTEAYYSRRYMGARRIVEN